MQQYYDKDNDRMTGGGSKLRGKINVKKFVENIKNLVLKLSTIERKLN